MSISYILPVLIAVFIYLSIPSFDFSELKNLNVVITGASSGLGEQIAYIYAENGANLMLLARSEDKLKRIVERCRTLGSPNAHYLIADMEQKSDEGFGKFVQKSKELLNGRIDTVILNHVRNTGNYAEEGWYGRFDMQDLEYTYYVNLFSYISLAQQYFPLLESTKGKLIVVGSAAGKVGLPKTAPYGGSKAALMNYFESLRYDMEEANSNVTITTCVIGSINTENARKATKKLRMPEFLWHSPRECGEAIIAGGESRVYEVFYPFLQTYPIVALRAFPSVVRFIIGKAKF